MCFGLNMVTAPKALAAPYDLGGGNNVALTSKSHILGDLSFLFEDVANERSFRTEGR